MKKYSNEMTGFIGCTKLLLIMVTVSLLYLPSVISAQGQPPGLPCRFHGTVQLDGSPAPDSTAVAALIRGNEVASAVTISANGTSSYSLTIGQPDGVSYTDGMTVEFSINGYKAQQIGAWRTGGNLELNLTASTPPTPTPTPSPSPTPTATPVPTLTPTLTSPPQPTATAVPPTPTPVTSLDVRRIAGVAVLGILALLLVGVLVYLLRRWFVQRR
jgi:hypothetical protein